MRPRLYDPTKPFQAPISMVKTPPAQHVLLLGTKESAVRLLLHWVNGLSLPCVEGECPYCHLDTRAYAYAPCLWVHSITNGKPRIEKALLPVPYTAFDLIDEYDANIWYEIDRKGGNKSGRMTWKRWQDRRAELTQPFHVLTHLKMLWEKRIAKLAPIDTWKQFVPQGTAEQAA